MLPCEKAHVGVVKRSLGDKIWKFDDVCSGAIIKCIYNLFASFKEGSFRVFYRVTTFNCNLIKGAQAGTALKLLLLDTSIAITALQLLFFEKNGGKAAVFHCKLYFPVRMFFP